MAFFKTPSGNIVCAYLGPMSANVERASVRCDIGSALKPLPKRPMGCNLDFGQGLSLSAADERLRAGASVTCAGDTLLGSPAPVLAYGKRFSRGGISCLSEFSGLTCRNAAGRGFFLSRQRWRTF
jgi:hypothetical protein